MVIDAVPVPERNNYRYWRGLHLGKIALNLVRERFYINAGEDGVIHFTDSHELACGYAKAETRPRDQYSPVTQWCDYDCELFKQMTGKPAPISFAGAVIAYGYNGRMEASTHGVGIGYSMNARIGFSIIDPYSRDALQNLFEVDLVKPGL